TRRPLDELRRWRPPSLASGSRCRRWRTPARRERRRRVAAAAVRSPGLAGSTPGGARRRRGSQALQSAPVGTRADAEVEVELAVRHGDVAERQAGTRVGAADA